MKENEKVKKGSLAVIGIVVLLSAGYVIPEIVMWIKDWSLKNEQQEVIIESIQIEVQDVDLLEAMGDFPDMLSKYLVVEKGDEFETYGTDGVPETNDSVSKALYMHVQEFLTMLDPKEEVELEKFYAQNNVMAVAGSEERAYSVWICKGLDKSGNEYYFWVDATLFKVLAFEIPFAVLGKGEEAFASAMDRLIAYYNFSVYDSWAHSYTIDISESLKLKYWENDLQILDKSLNEILSVCMYKNADSFLFNVYPGTKNRIQNVQISDEE